MRIEQVLVQIYICLSIAILLCLQRLAAQALHQIANARALALELDLTAFQLEGLILLLDSLTRRWHQLGLLAQLYLPGNILAHHVLSARTAILKMGAVTFAQDLLQFLRARILAADSDCRLLV